MINNLQAKPCKVITDLRHLVDSSAEMFHDKILYHYKDYKNDNEFKTLTYGERKSIIDAVGTAFAKFGIMGKTVAVVGDSHPHYHTAYYATVNGGGTIVPIDREISKDELCNFINHAECEVVVYTEVLNGFPKEAKDKLPNVKYYIPINENTEDLSDSAILPFSKLIADGNEELAKGNRQFLDHVIDMDKTCTIIFTSGTTGTSKGVMLSQKNLTAATNASCLSMSYDDTRNFISFLPPYHSYEMTCGQFAISNLGATIFINDSLKHTMKNINSFKPNALMLVPLFVETMHKKIWDEIRKRKLEGFMHIAIKASNGLCSFGIDLRKKLFGAVTSSLGGELTSIVCGGAPISPQIIKDFYALGITVLEGYGITECAPLVAVNRPGKVKFRSVGTAVENCTVKIDYDKEQPTGEILVKGDNVMQGYYKNPEATKAVFTEDGYFRTGDIGYMDDEGYIFITGRKKNVIIASNGKNVFPEELEEYLSRIPNILESVVVGRKNKNDELVVTAIIVPDMNILQGKNFDEVFTIINGQVTALNKKLPAFKQIKHVEIRYEEFEKTPSRKIKRFLVS
jgi:long-chain acyl-CoA synthetase